MYCAPSSFALFTRAVAAVLVLLPLARAEDIGRGGVKAHIPAGSDDAVLVLKNKVASNGIAEEIIDFDIAICTPGSDLKLVEVDLNGISEGSDDTWVDDDNDESLEEGETDDKPPAPAGAVRLQVHGGSSDGRIDANHDFELRIKLDAAAGPGGVDVQITPTDEQGDAYIRTVSLDGPETLATLTAGSNDAYLELLNHTGAPIEQLAIGASLPGTIDSSKTWSPTIPWNFPVNGWVVFADAFVPVGGVILAHVQLDGPAQPGQPFELRILAGATAATFCGCASGPCGNDDPQAGCRNATGAGAHLTALGSSRLSDDNLVLRMTPLAPNKFGLFFMGTQPTNQTFGDGQRCVGGSLYRFPVQNSGGGGEVVFGPIAGWANANFPPSGHIVAGSLWLFQGWYRDPQGPCGAGFNLTDAVRVPFAP